MYSALTRKIRLYSNVMGSSIQFRRVLVWVLLFCVAASLNSLLSARGVVAWQGTGGKVQVHRFREVKAAATIFGNASCCYWARRRVSQVKGWRHVKWASGDPSTVNSRRHTATPPTFNHLFVTAMTTIVWSSFWDKNVKCLFVNKPFWTFYDIIIPFSNKYLISWSHGGNSTNSTSISWFFFSPQMAKAEMEPLVLS